MSRTPRPELIAAKLYEGYKEDWRKNEEMDILNDWVGWYAYIDGSDTPEELCVTLKDRARRGIFIGPYVNPFRWAKKHDYQKNRVVFRQLRARDGSFVKLNRRNGCFDMDT